MASLVIATARELGVAVIGYSPVGRGFVSAGDET